ncbi:unnamed protein product [Sympodiomycopsis kandeliae]
MSSGDNTAGSGNNPNTAGDGVPPTATDAPPSSGSSSRPPAARTSARAIMPAGSTRAVPNPMFRPNPSNAMNGRSPTPGGGLASARPTVSMVPSRGGMRTSSGSSASSSSTAAGPSRMSFKPVIPQRRKPSETVPQVKQEEPSTSLPSGSADSPAREGGDRGRGRGRGRGAGRGGRGGGRQPIEMVASGPFSMGTGSLSKYERTKRIQSGSSAGSGPSGGGKWQGETEADNLKPGSSMLRQSYRNPDQLKDKEEYSDQEEEVEIVDLDDVGVLDFMAPRALPRMQERENKKKSKSKSKKDKEKKKATKPKATSTIKADPEAMEAEEQSRLQPDDKKAVTVSPSESDSESDSDSDRPKDGKVVDALDLSESEEEEMMDDLVDDFLFDQQDGLDGDARGVDPSNRLYLFQFPQLFPQFAERPGGGTKQEEDEPVKKEDSVPKSALSSSPPGTKGRRSVAFAEGTTGGSGAPNQSPASGIKREHDQPDPLSTTPTLPSGRIGSLKVYKDGRVEMHFSPPEGSKAPKLVMELTGGSQTSFLQDLTLLDPISREAYILGEIQRKFVCSPSVESMLDDALVLGDQVKTEEEQS